jgi:hypothetical protein
VLGMAGNQAVVRYKPAPCHMSRHFLNCSGACRQLPALQYIR